MKALLCAAASAEPSRCEQMGNTRNMPTAARGRLLCDMVHLGGDICLVATEMKNVCSAPSDYVLLVTHTTGQHRTTCAISTTQTQADCTGDKTQKNNKAR